MLYRVVWGKLGKREATRNDSYIPVKVRERAHSSFVDSVKRLRFFNEDSDGENEAWRQGLMLLDSLKIAMTD